MTSMIITPLDSEGNIERVVPCAEESKPEKFQRSFLGSNGCPKPRDNKPYIPPMVIYLSEK
jgi:hypothetical protein